MRVPAQLIFGLLLLSGCATTREVKITAASNPRETDNYSYVTVTTQEHDPLYADLEQSLEAALSGKGLYPVGPDGRPGIIVKVGFGMDEETGFKPVFREVEIPGEWGMLPRTVLIEGVRPYIIYIKKLSLVGSAPDADSAPVWIIYAEIADEHDDLKQSLPILMAAALKKIGAETDGEITLKIGPDDPDLIFVTTQQ